MNEAETRAELIDPALWAAGWGCPHEEDGKCNHVPGRECDPGMKGCVLSGRFTFSNEDKNVSRRQKEKNNGKGKDGR